MKRGKEQDWQREGNRVTTESGYVQLWSAGGSMLTAQMPVQVARDLVNGGGAFVMTKQAVGRYDG